MIRYLLAAVVVMGLMLVAAGRHIVAQDALIAAKPRIVVEYRDRVVTKTVKGPERIVTKTVIAPDGTRTITKEADRGEVVKTSDTEHVSRKTETPICPTARRAPSRYAGLIFGANGYGGSWVKGARGGINVMENWDLGGHVSRERDGATVLGGDVIFRW